MKTKFKQTLAIIITLTIMLCSLSACDTNPEKSILGKWYNDDGDCLEIQSDNTFRVNFVKKIGTTIGSGSGKWVYLEEENLFKFYSNDDKIWEINIFSDKYGENFEYSYYGVFYKNEFPVEIIEEMEEQYLESTVVCPNFVGKSYEEIINDKEYEGILNFTTKWEYSEHYEYGIVFEQSEVANERILKNSTVTLYISEGIIRTLYVYEIPDIYGMQEDDAVSELEKIGFSNIVVTQINNDETEKGCVAKSEPERNMKVPKDQKVILYISK